MPVATAIITTSHRPSYRTRSFIKDLVSVLPGSIRVHRGKKTLLQLALEARVYGCSYVIVVGEKRGNPSLLRVYSLGGTGDPSGVIRHYASIIMRGVRLSREVAEAHRVYNPETINIDPGSCSSDECFHLADIFLSILEKRLSTTPDITMVLEERGGIVVRFVSRTGRPCGPVLRVEKVKIIGG